MEGEFPLHERIVSRFPVSCLTCFTHNGSRLPIVFKLTMCHGVCLDFWAKYFSFCAHSPQPDTAVCNNMKAQRAICMAMSQWDCEIRDRDFDPFGKGESRDPSPAGQQPEPKLDSSSWAVTPSGHAINAA